MIRVTVGIAAGALSVACPANALAAGAGTVDLGPAIPVQTITGEILRNTPVNIDVLRSTLKSVRVPAQTNERGIVPFRTVAEQSWIPASALDSTVILPSDGLAAIYGSDATSGVVNLIPRRTFGLRDGNLISGRDWARGVTSPFWPPCHTTRGAPKTLATGFRFAYEIPGDAKNLDWVRNQPYVVDPHFFRLPEGRGYAGSSAAGQNPESSRAKLTKLEQKGIIRNLEEERECWRYFPEVDDAREERECSPGGPTATGGSARITGDFGATLRDARTGTPIPGAWVLFGPVSPTFFFDPGERPGDSEPPTFTRTGSDGSYRAVLGGLRGPMEITVADQCNSRTTLAIAGAPAQQGGPAPAANKPEGSPPRPGTGTGGTVSRNGSGKQPGKSPPSSRPREKPAEGMRVCGPNVTDYVFGVMQMIMESYASWSYWTRAEKCLGLYNPWGFHFNGAWDMQLFTPSDGENYMSHIFFQRAAPDYCAVPRSPCGGTVEFLGFCIKAQVVNYAQWGLMNELCDNQLFGASAVLVRSAISSDQPGQLAMMEVGQAFARVKGDLRQRRDTIARNFPAYVKEYEDAWYAMEGTDCALVCEEIAPEASKWLENQSWGFQWGWETEPVVKRGNVLPKP